MAILFGKPTSRGPPTRDLGDPAARELRHQIEAILKAGHLAPLRFSGADQKNEGFYLYTTSPGRILNTLGAAFPFLTRDQQALVRTYVRQELARPEYTP